MSTDWWRSHWLWWQSPIEECARCDHVRAFHVSGGRCVKTVMLFWRCDCARFRGTDAG